MLVSLLILKFVPSGPHYATNFRIGILGADSEPLRFARPRGGALLTNYLEQLAADWEMVFQRPETFVVEDDFVAMFGLTSWTYRKNGKTMTTPFAHLWRFSDGKAVELTELFDTALVAGVAAEVPPTESDNGFAVA